MNKLIKRGIFPLSAAVIMGCVTTIRPLGKSQLRPEIKITEESLISDYFGEKKDLSFNKIGGTLEKIIENDFSKIFRLNIDLAPINYKDIGDYLVITKKRSLNIIYSKSFSRLREKDIKQIKKLAEKKKYSFCVIKIQGYAADTLFNQNIRINPNKDLFSLVHIIAHEGAHTLFFKEGKMYPINNLFISDLKRNEKIAINETSCNIIGDKIAEYFKEHHLIHKTKLYESYEKSRKSYIEYKKDMQEFIKEYEELPEKLKIKNSPAIIKNFEQKIKKKYNLDNLELNEARLAIEKRYSGDREVYNKLNFLFDNLGGYNFIKLTSYLYNKKDLHKFYEKIKSKK